MLNIETTLVKDWTDPKFRHPSRLYIVNALGQRLYFHTRDTTQAREYVDTYLGKGKYTIQVVLNKKQMKAVTAKSSINSASRKGMNFMKMKNNWGAGEG